MLRPHVCRRDGGRSVPGATGLGQSLAWLRFRCLQTKRAMRALRVVVVDEFAENGWQVLLVKHDEVIQALAAERPDHAFCDCVRLWRVNRCGDAVDADPLCPLAREAPTAVATPEPLTTELG